MLDRRTGALPENGAVFEAAVAGIPKPKGSLKNVARRGQKTRLVEQVADSPEWKMKMVRVFRRSVRLGDGSNPVLALPGFPYDDAVIVYATFVFEKPLACIHDYPQTTTYGDTDKLVRNLGDALQQAGVLKEDSRVVEWHAKKRFRLPDEGAGGVLVQVVDARTMDA